MTLPRPRIPKQRVKGFGFLVSPSLLSIARSSTSSIYAGLHPRGSCSKARRRCTTPRPSYPKRLGFSKWSVPRLALPRPGRYQPRISDDNDVAKLDVFIFFLHQIVDDWAEQERCGAQVSMTQWFFNKLGDARKRK